MSYNFLDKTGLTYLWAKIKAYITKNTTPLINGTQATSTSAWTGVAPFSELVDGQVINFYLPFASTNTAVTLNLTLSDGTTTGALPVYYNNSTERMTTHYGRGSIITLVYKASRINSSGTTITNSWLKVADRDTTDICTLRFENGSMIAGENGVINYGLCALDSVGRYQSFVTTSGTGTTKTVNTNAKFRNPMVMCRNGANTKYTNGQEVGTGYNSYYVQRIDARYSCNGYGSFEKNTPTYLECTKDSDGYLSVTSNTLVQTFRSGYYYVYVGHTCRDQIYTIQLQPNHPIYYYDGSKLINENETKVDVLGHATVSRAVESSGYLKFAECDLSFGGYGNKYVVLFMTTEYATNGKDGNGIIYINIRGNGANASSVTNFYWLLNDDSASIDTLYWAVNDHKIEFYRKVFAANEYAQVSFKVLHIGNFETAKFWKFNLLDVPLVEGTPLDTPIGDVHAIVSGGKVKNAEVATTATKATGDKNGNDITTTYYKATNPNGYTSNTGTITGIKMNGASKGTSGVVDLGTVITAHQDISGKQDKLTAGSNIQITNNTISATDTKYSSKAAASGGTDVSLVTTGEKYTWNNKQNALSSQTAYTSKGSATKVPQITTNSLGQVTGIEEVTITQPTVNNGTLTIQKNGTSVGTFTANQSGNSTANITVPTKTTDLTNDSGFIESEDETVANIVSLTKEEYDALDTKTPNTLYNIIDDYSLSDVYPVGSIYMSVNNVNPGTLFGGTWEQIKDTFLLSAGDTYTAGTTGGEATHTLTVDEMPSHTHKQNSHSHGYKGSAGWGDGTLSKLEGQSGSIKTATTNGATATNQNTGGGKAHNNMPPYLVVYVWKRVS